jgi:hypothetical protein
MPSKKKQLLPFNDLKTIHGVQAIILYSEKSGIKEKLIPETLDNVDFHKMAEGIISSLLKARHDFKEFSTLSIFYKNYSVFLKRIPDKKLYAVVLGGLDMDINLLEIAMQLVGQN